MQGPIFYLLSALSYMVLFVAFSLYSLNFMGKKRHGTVLALSLVFLGMGVLSGYQWFGVENWFTYLLRNFVAFVLLLVSFSLMPKAFSPSIEAGPGLWK